MVNLDVTDRQHALVVVVVVDLGRLDEHLAVVRPRWRFGAGRLRIEGETLRGRRRYRCSLDQSRERKRCDDRQNRGHDDSVAAHSRAPPVGGRQSLAGGDNGHYPSSWYNKAKKPVRPPTHTGNHAAATGCINSALLKSVVTFCKT